MINFSDIGPLQPTAADIKYWDDFHQSMEDRQQAILSRLTFYQGDISLAECGSYAAEMICREVAKRTLGQ